MNPMDSSMQPSSSQQIPLVVSDIHKRFGDLHVPEGISLTSKGDVISLIGSSGSG